MSFVGKSSDSSQLCTIKHIYYDLYDNLFTFKNKMYESHPEEIEHIAD